MSDIAIIYGGRSGEHEVSCISAAAVLNNLNPDHRAILIGISRKGIWYLQDIPSPIPGSLGIIEQSSRRISISPGAGLFSSEGERIHIDAVIPVTHGSFGEDGRLQGLLETAGVAYAGSGVSGSATAMDKDTAKRLWLQAGLPVVPWKTLYAGRNNRTDFSEKKISPEILFEELGRPLFVKPANAGSSVGVSRVENEKELNTALKKAWRFDRKVLVEKAVIGREIECSVMGYATPQAYPPGEIIPAGMHEFYDYDAKYTDPDGALLKVPADLSENLERRIMRTAEKAYRVIEAGGFSRVDFLLEEGSGNIYINEINTLPGMTPISLFPRMISAAGVDFTSMLEKMIEGALEEFAFRESLSYRK